MPSTYEVLSPNGHYTMAESIFTKLKDYMDAHGPGSKVDRAGDTMTGTLNFTTTNCIGYSGVYATYPMIKFIDATDVYGNGIVIGGGGASIMGGGESSTVMAEQVSNGGSEILYLGNDGNVDIFSNLQNGWASRRHVAFNTNGSLVFDDTVTANVIIPARSVSYIQGNNGNAGIYAKKTLNTDQWYPIICMDTKAGGSWAVGNYNNEHFQFSYATKANRDANNNSTSIMYMQAGDTGRILTSSNYSSYCAASSHTHNESSITWSNNTLYTIGDDVKMGDGNASGCLVLQGANAATGLYFKPYSGSTAQKISIDGAGTMTISGTVNVSGTLKQGGTAVSLSGHTHSYLPLSGGTITGGVTMNSTCSIKGSLSCYAGIELRASTNYIDFHVNQSSADYTARIIESSSGKLTAYNSISNSSDRRLKKDIEDLDITYIELLNEVRPRQFRYIKGDEFLYTGFIAQEFEDAMKEVGIIDIPVVTPPNNIDEYYGLDYGQVTAILWKICQHQQSEIDELKSKIA